MVILGKEREREAEKLMGMERSKPLHNFKMPWVKWGNQKLLRCMNVNPSGADSSATADRMYSAPGVEKGLIGRRRRESEDERWGLIDGRESFKKSPSPSSSPAAEALGGRLKEIDGNNGIEAVREKLMFDLHAAADKLKFALFGEGSGEAPPPPTPTEKLRFALFGEGSGEPPPPPSPAEKLRLALFGEGSGEPPVAANASVAVRPWNLRTRRAACKAPSGATGGGGYIGVGGRPKSLRIDERKPNFSPLRTENRSPKLRSGDVTSIAPNNLTGGKRDRKEFSVSLSRREIEEDFISITGHKPPRRPKNKRAKIVQKQLDRLSPAFWLTEVTADMYKVSEVPETGKI